MAENGLLASIVDHAQSIGYEVVVGDTSRGDGALSSSLVFVRGPEGALYSISVELVA